MSNPWVKNGEGWEENLISTSPRQEINYHCLNESLCVTLTVIITVNTKGKHSWAGAIAQERTPYASMKTWIQFPELL